MQNRISRIRVHKPLVREIVAFLSSQVGNYNDLSMDVVVPPPPRTYKHIKDLDLRVEIIHPNATSKLKFEGKYDPNNSVLYVNLPYFESQYEGRELEEALYKLVAHELVHVYQIIYTRVRDNDPNAVNPTAGLPSLRERTPQYRQETGEILHHRLDDNEFYPRLEDTINAIEFVSRGKPNETASIVSYVVGESSRPVYRSKHLKEPMEWLTDLGRYAPRKFLKAVRKIKNEFPETAKMRQADFFRQVSPPDELSSFSNGTPTGKSTDLKDKGEGSQLPNGDGARNIGRPSPDSPSLKSRNLDRSESYGRKPAEGFDAGYVHDSGSGSARVIPYDSGFANNSSIMRTSARQIRIDKASGVSKKNVPVDEKLWAEIQALAKGESSKSVSRGEDSVNPVNDGKGFDTFPSAYANGWALAQYKRLGGKWKKQSSSSRVAHRYLESAKRDDPKKKNTGKGGLDTWFAGHGGGDPDDRATWGDWIAITPIKHTITKEDGKKKTYEPGDIVGPCAISSEKEWSDVTSGGKKPLKCMPREKAWKMPKKDRAELAKKKKREEAKHRGKKPVNTPTFSEKAKEVTKKKSSVSKVVFRFLLAGSQPAQDLAGVKTWVDKNRQDQINNDTSAPEKSREDYEDGKPQRDRVLPLPSGHPEGRDEQRVGPGQINSPPDSSGQGGANRPKKDPSALNDHPDGKALHERPRSSGMPGDEYGHPYIDQSTSTGLKRRVMASIEKISYVDEDDFYAEEEDFYWDIEDGVMVKNALFRYNFRPPRGNKRQRSQKGQAKRKSLKNKRKNRVKYRRNLIKQKRLYKRKKHNPTYKKYKKNYAKNPQKYKRRPGGVSTVKQKNQRAEKRRK